MEKDACKLIFWSTRRVTTATPRLTLLTTYYSMRRSISATATATAVATRSCAALVQKKKNQIGCGDVVQISSNSLTVHSTTTPGHARPPRSRSTYEVHPAGMLRVALSVASAVLSSPASHRRRSSSSRRKGGTRTWHKKRRINCGTDRSRCQSPCTNTAAYARHCLR